jgi:hypothetical protein
MNKLNITLAVSAIIAFGTSSGAHAGPTCEGMGWKNHGEHVLTYVNGGGAGGGAPAHLSARPGGPAPGASFCLTQSNSPGVHF